MPPRSQSDAQDRRRSRLDLFTPEARPPRFAVRDVDFDQVLAEQKAAAAQAPPASRVELKLARIETIKAAHRTRATRLLARIPEPACSVHMMTGGSFDFWDYIHAILDLAAPRVCDQFYGSTWIMNRTNAKDLLALMDAGRIRKVGIITGVYFQRRESSVFHMIYEGLRRRGQRFKACANHSKWFAMALDDGTRLVAEGSANFTENGNAEQVAITHSPELFDYYREWAEEVLGDLPLVDLKTCERDTLEAFDPSAPLKPAKVAHRRRPAAQGHAGIGAFCATRDQVDRRTVQQWKSAPRPDPGWTGHFARGLADLVRATWPVLPPGTIVTTPPAGTSAYLERPNAARALADEVARILDVPRLETLHRTDTKRYRGPEYSRHQAPYRIREIDPKPSLAIVCDDLITTGTTMRLALEALRSAGVNALGIAYAGR